MGWALVVDPCSATGSESYARHVLSVGVLGPVAVRDDGVPLELPAGKTTELLARLALEAGGLVRADALIEDLWAAPTGRNTLQATVSRLRRALGRRDLVLAAGPGYRLVVAAEEVDAVQAVRLAQASATARAAGDPATSLARSREGLALFRGEVLVDAGDWAEAHRSRLEEVRLGLVEDAVTARIDLGAGAELVPELELLVGEHPLRERLWAALVTALYRAGRQADALAAYARVRRLLVDELGVEPGPALRRLEQQVLRQSRELGASARQPDRPERVPGNVPAAAGPTVGRAGDVAAVVGALTSARLVTLVGPAGVGKTRLALEVASRLTPPGGVWLVRLDAVTPEVDLAQVLADTLHVPGGGRGLAERLCGAETVLLLDNCEHLLDSVAGLVAWLLDTAPPVRVLATSQAALGLEHEQRRPVEPLSQPESVALFGVRAQELRRGFALDPSTAAVVAEICLSLDGLPLAIELASARVRSLSVADIARHLDDRFLLLRDPGSHRPERRRALEAAIGWSYDLLFPDDQRGLWALSAFAGSASLDAAGHVLRALGVPARSVLDTIGRLVDRSLVIADADERGAVRYRLLDSIRAYAADRLQDEGLGAVAASAHAEWYADRAAWCDEHVRTARQPECLRVARDERPNVDAALAWCAQHDPLRGMRIAVGFGWTWVVLGDGSAAATRVRDALVADGPAREQATGRLLAAWLEASAGDLARAQDDLDAGRRLAEELGDELLVADVDRHQAFVAIQQGRPDLVVQSAAASLSRYRERRLTWRTAGSLLLGAFGALMLGDTARAAQDAREARTLVTAIGDGWGLMHAQAMLAGIAQAEGRFAEAAEALEQAAAESAVLGYGGQAALHRATLARVQQRANDPRALDSFRRALADAHAVGDGRLAATVRVHLARLRRAAGDPDGAAALLAENQRWYAAAGGGDFALLTDALLAALHDDGPRLTAVLSEARAVRLVEVQVTALDALARLAAAAGDDGTVRSLLAEADALATQVAHLLDPADRWDRSQLAGTRPG